MNVGVLSCLPRCSMIGGRPDSSEVDVSCRHLDALKPEGLRDVGETLRFLELKTRRN